MSFSLEAISAVFSRYHSLDSSTLQHILNQAEYFEVKKKDILLREGEVCRYFYILLEGNIKSVHSHDGQEFTNWAYFDQVIFTSWYSFMLQQASLESLYVIEASKGYRLSFDRFHQLRQELPEFALFLTEFYQVVLGLYDFTSKKAYAYSAREKYEFLLAYEPGFLHRVSVKDLAAILGISRETLSRIRAEKK